eukprot:2156784-Pleurochrysis_carterae.AAC.1
MAVQVVAVVGSGAHVAAPSLCQRTCACRRACIRWRCRCLAIALAVRLAATKRLASKRSECDRRVWPYARA